MASINFNANENSIEGKSHVILRTNPVLTSNVKLVVDSSGEIYLDSINANRTLSDQRYKKFNLDRNGHFAYDIASYYANTPFETVYEPLRRDSDLSVYREYNKQYEEQYNYGARLNGSKDFDENIRFTAPLWINEKLPEYFVIYRIEEPVSEVSLDDTIFGIDDRIMQMLKNATIVKSFDLRKGSIVGDYLDRFANDESRPKAPLTLSFEKDEKTSWNGIDLRKGGFTSKGEYIYRDFVATDREEILNNKFITDGFKRNQMISANLINMEFLFEDFDNAYDVNRYIGVYVNAHEEGSFKPVKYSKNDLLISENTLETKFNLTGTGLTHVDMLPNNELDFPVLQWVKSGNSFGHILNNPQNNPLRLKVNSFDINNDKYVKKDDSLRITNVLDNAKDFITIEVVDTPTNAEEFILTTYTEYLIEGSNPLYYALTADSSLPAGSFERNKFSNNGTTVDITNAILGAVRLFEDLQLNITIKGNKLFIENYKAGNRTNAFFTSIELGSTAFEVNGLINTNQIDLDPYITTKFNTYLPHGGSYQGFGFLIEESETGDITDETYVKSGAVFIKIVEVIQDPIYTQYYRVCLDGKISNLKLKDNSVALWVENRVTFGKFEALDFHDFDYNFYSTANSDLGELQYEKDYVIENVVYEDVLIDPNDPSLGYEPKQVNSLSTDFVNLEGVKLPVTPNSSGKSSVSTEYDRLKENYTTELALESRVIPTINKWKYFEGVNGKELPYMLTMSESFGKTNFSPDIERSGRNINSMTHEWFYLYKHPKYTGITTDSDVADMVKKLTSYIQPEATINLDYNKLIDVNNNWFDRLFIYDGYDVPGAGFAPAIPTNKYVRLRGGSTKSPAEALFRGLKVKLYDRKEFNESNPKNLIASTSFNDYKFTAVLNYNNNTSEDSVSIKAIQNKAFNFVCLYIELNSSETEIESLNRTLLYSLRDFFSGGQAVDTFVNGYVDFSIPQDGSSKYLDGLGIGTNLLLDLQLNEDGSYNNIKFEYPSGGDTWVLPILEVYSETSIRISVNDNGKISNESQTNELDITQVPSGDWSNIVLNYENGGYKLAESLLKSVSAKNIATLLNNNDTTHIEYITVEENGDINNNRFIINIEDGNKVQRISNLVANPDPNKPNSFKVAAGSIGYVVDERLDAYVSNLIRMSGHYTPHSRPVVSFTDLYSEYKTDQLISPNIREQMIYNSYNRLGIAFSSYIDRGQYKYGLIEDLFYHKVNPEKADGILKLSNSTGSQPKYPLINEVAIDKKDVNVFRSSWEDEYYVKNGSNKNDSNVYGTLSTHEESAFLASTLNLPKSQYEITKYANIKDVTSIDAMKSLKAAGNFTGDIIKYEDVERVYMDIYLDNLLITLLEKDGAGHSIQKHVIASESYGDKTSLRDDIRKYIEVNLLKLMNINDILVYSKDDKSISNSVVLSADSLNDILDSGFTEAKDFRIEYDNTNPLNIRLIYNKRAGFRHQLYIYAKIRS